MQPEVSFHYFDSSIWSNSLSLFTEKDKPLVFFPQEAAIKPSFSLTLTTVFGGLEAMFSIYF